MHFSAQEAYGLRCMMQLARNQENGDAITARQISESETISLDYVHKLLGILKRKGLVESNRGINGGFRLSKDPSRISVNDVLGKLLSEVNADGHCAKFNRGGQSCPWQEDCDIKPFLEAAFKFCEELSSRITLQDILDHKLPKIEVKIS
jgi:Rrf2 family transcriptional regulator, cysteine metabolism repressor